MNIAVNLVNIVALVNLVNIVGSCLLRSSTQMTTQKEGLRAIFGPLFSVRAG